MLICSLNDISSCYSPSSRFSLGHKDSVQIRPVASYSDMANLSPTDHTIIAKYPLGISLDHLHDSLRKVEQNYEPGSLSHHDAVDSPDSGPQQAISRLLVTLMDHEAALDLQSKTRSGDIASELFKLRKRVRNGDFDYKYYRMLSRLVIKQAPDIDIWDAVFDLIITVSRITPPTSIPVSSDGTPITISSSSFQDSEQTRRIIESAMFYKIKRCTYRDVDGFFEKYFEEPRWSRKSKAIYKAMNKQYRDG